MVLFQLHGVYNAKPMHAQHYMLLVLSNILDIGRQRIGLAA